MFIHIKLYPTKIYGSDNMLKWDTLNSLGYGLIPSSLFLVTEQVR